MKYIISYADPSYEKAQAYNTKTAYKKGGADKVIPYKRSDIDPAFYQKNRDILEANRGGGYWLWKPYFVNKTLSQIQDGDYLFYCDAGAYFVNSIDHLIRTMEKNGDAMMLFALPCMEKEYTKRDIFLYLDADTPAFTDSRQTLGGFILLKKTKTTVALVKEWLQVCQTGALITDADNQLGKENYPEFIENRHDQSILSVIGKKYGITGYRNPSQGGNGRGIAHTLFRNKRKRRNTKSDYPMIVLLHRSKEVIWPVKWNTYLAFVFPKGYRLLQKWKGGFHNH